MSKIKEEIEKYRGLYPNMPIDDVIYLKDADCFVTSY